MRISYLNGEKIGRFSPAAQLSSVTAILTFCRVVRREYLVSGECFDFVSIAHRFHSNQAIFAGKCDFNTDHLGVSMQSKPNNCIMAIGKQKFNSLFLEHGRARCIERDHWLPTIKRYCNTQHMCRHAHTHTHNSTFGFARTVSHKNGANVRGFFSVRPS